MGSTSLPPPTADELARWEACIEHGICIACASEGQENHHLLSEGGNRLGHRYTVFLCETCHSQVKTRTFKKHYPNDWLLAQQDLAIGWPCVELPKARARNPARSRCLPGRKTFPRSPKGFA